MPAATESQSQLPPLATPVPSRYAGGIFALWLGAMWFLLILICSVWLRFPGVMVNGGEISYDRGLFVCINCATLTGFQQAIGSNDFNPDSSQGPAIVLILTIAGSLFAMMAGGLAAVRALRMPYGDRQVITAAMTVELVAVSVGMAASSQDSSSFDLIYRSACAFGNSGAVFMTSPGHHYFPGYQSWTVQGILLPLSVIGGLGLPVLMELYFRAIGAIKQLSHYTKTTIKITAAIYLIATAVLFASQILHTEPLIAAAPVAPPVGFRSALLASSTAAINCRTLGMPFEYLHPFPKTATWFMVLLMAIGAGSASTGGGLKITTLYKLFTGFGDILHSRPVNRTFAVAGVWVGLYLFFAAVSFVLLTILQPQVPADRLMFLTFSALSNVGLTQDLHDPVSIVGPSLYLLGFVALLGRVTPIAILWWLAKSADADVLVG